MVNNVKAGEGEYDPAGLLFLAIRPPELNK